MLTAVLQRSVSKVCDRFVVVAIMYDQQIHYDDYAGEVVGLAKSCSI
jgi:hypothetical protein